MTKRMLGGERTGEGGKSHFLPAGALSEVAAESSPST